LINKHLKKPLESHGPEAEYRVLERLAIMIEDSGIDPELAAQVLARKIEITPDEGEGT
jgi:hypothetical protein